MSGQRLRKLLVLVLGAGFLLFALANCSNHRDWHTASRASSGMAPDPALTDEAVLLVYGAPAWSWRGWFAIHTWIAAKPQGARDYTVYEVIGWQLRRSGSVVRIARDFPDRYWYGEKPRLLKEHRGGKTEELIRAVDQAARNYPWFDQYTLFPGPNSNTFTAWIGLQVPALELDLPFSAIGSGYAKHGD